MEFELKHGKPERTEAMKAGSDRHAQLEHEVRTTFLVLPSRMLLHLHGFYLEMRPGIINDIAMENFAVPHFDLFHFGKGFSKSGYRP